MGHGGGGILLDLDLTQFQKYNSTDRVARRFSEGPSQTVAGDLHRSPGRSRCGDLTKSLDRPGVAVGKGTR